MPWANVTKPTRPRNINTTRSNLAASPNWAVIPREEPTVPKADTHSKIIALSGKCGSRTVIIKTKSVNMPMLTKTATLALRKESSDSSRPANSTRDSSRPANSTRSEPRTTARILSRLTAKAFTLIPPAVDCEAPPIHISMV